MSLTLIGLGVQKGDISLAAAEKIDRAELVIVKTCNTCNYSYFLERGIEVVSLDDQYKKSRNFDTLRSNVAKKVLALSKGKEAVYCVDGSVLEDEACKLILSKARDVEVISGVSKVASALERIGFTGGYSAVSAYDVENFNFNGGVLCVYDLDSAVLAGEVKLRLMETYGDECPCVAVVGQEKFKISLYEMDRLEKYDYSVRLVVTPRDFLHKDRYTYDDLCYILKILRGENGCPWDRAQTHESIRINAVEEAYELVDAIDRQDDERITEEIGDVLMQAVFHTTLGEERGALTKGEVLTGVCKKLINRHTHIFFGDTAADEAEALVVWERNKVKEHGFTPKQAVADVPEVFPALLRTEKVQKRAIKAGNAVKDKGELSKKIGELTELLVSGSSSAEVVGELLFNCVELARQGGVECETALSDFTRAFVKRVVGE